MPNARKNLLLLADNVTAPILDALASICEQPLDYQDGFFWAPLVNDSFEIRQKIFALAHDHKLDAAILSSDAKLSDYKAVFFDMDSTLVNSETLDEIAAIHGVGEQCAEITAGAMSGKITDYADSLRKRVALLRGMCADSIETVWQHMTPNPGAELLIQKATDLGLSTYIVSSGFTLLTEKMRKKLGMTATCANRIDIVDGHYTGRVFGPVDETILDANGKLAFVNRTMAERQFDTTYAICCGDGSNDVRMIDAAGVGVGFRPKAVLQPHCDVVLNNRGFDGLLMLFNCNSACVRD